MHAAGSRRDRGTSWSYRSGQSRHVDRSQRDGIFRAGFSVPVFVLAYILILTFSIELDWLPVQGYRNFDEASGKWLRHLILPSIALGRCTWR